MATEKVYYTCFLSNVGPSILKLKLNHGFTIKALSEEEALAFLTPLEGSTTVRSCKTISDRIFQDYHLQNWYEKKERLYTVNNNFPTTSSKRRKELGEFDVNFIRAYIQPNVRLMRLFEEGDVRTPLEYYYLVKNGKPKLFLKLALHGTVPLAPYKLKNSEMPLLHRFLRNTNLPFSEPFINLAFQNYELSYTVDEVGLSFLALMVGLEVLLNPGEGELTYRIARNAAVLLGKDAEDSREIFSSIRRLYEKRSSIVHAGKSSAISRDDVLMLRYYLRESIKKILGMHEDKTSILSLLNESGFGSRGLREPL